MNPPIHESIHLSIHESINQFVMHPRIMDGMSIHATNPSLRVCSASTSPPNPFPPPPLPCFRRKTHLPLSTCTAHHARTTLFIPSSSHHRRESPTAAQQTKAKRAKTATPPPLCHDPLFPIPVRYAHHTWYSLLCYTNTCTLSLYLCLFCLFLTCRSYLTSIVRSLLFRKQH